MQLLNESESMVVSGGGALADDVLGFLGTLSLGSACGSGITMFVPGSAGASLGIAVGATDALGEIINCAEYFFL